jgi:DNA oxidative demethylase
MTATPGGAIGDLLSGTERGTVSLGEGAGLLRGFARAEAARLIQVVRGVAEAAPFRHMITRGGHQMSVAMTNCGTVGWVTDRSGYRYDPVDPLTGRPWPSMPDSLLALAARAAAECGFSRFEPDACLMNEYQPGARLSLHQDADELDFAQPIVSVSLGLPAVFLFGGGDRGDKPRRVRLESGDVVVWGGPARLAFHGVEPLADGFDALTGPRRINLSFRRAL